MVEREDITDTDETDIFEGDRDGRPGPVSLWEPDLVGLYLKDAESRPGEDWQELTYDQQAALAKTYQQSLKAKTQLKTIVQQELERRQELEKEIRQGDWAMDVLVRAHKLLVVSIAQRYENEGIPLSDRVQEGNLGLMEAAKRYNKEKGVKFSTYASWWIRQGISRAVYDQSRTVRMPVHREKEMADYREAEDILWQENQGRQPVLKEIAKVMGVSIPKARGVQKAIIADQGIASLDQQTGEKEYDRMIEMVQGNLQNPEDAQIQRYLKEQCAELLEKLLTPKEVKVLKLRFGLEDGTSYILDEVGKKLGLTRERIRQIQTKALLKLRRYFLQVESTPLKEYL